MAVSSDAIMSCEGLVKLKELEEVLSELEVGALKPCRLLELPRELRDIVYEFALTTDRPILIWSNEWHWEEVLTTNPRAAGASLLYTCQQINCEARQIFHQRNLFAIRLDVTLEAEHSSLQGALETRAGIPPLPKVILPTEEIRTLKLYLDGLWDPPHQRFSRIYTHLLWRYLAA